MPYSIYYFDEVEIDLIEARTWYKSIEEKLELRFISVLETTILKLLVWPKSYSIRYKNIRIIHLPIFPYQIHFYIDEVEHKIVIVAIIHGNRHPDIARNRLK